MATTEEPRLQIVGLNPLTFQYSVCGARINGEPAPSDVTAQFSNHVRDKHPLYYRGTEKRAR